MYYGTCITYIQNPDMHTLAALDTLRITPRILGSVRAIAEAKGQEVLYQKQVPQALETLRQAALIQSTESSNRIEGVYADHARISVATGVPPVGGPQTGVGYNPRDHSGRRGTRPASASSMEARIDSRSLGRRPPMGR